jgi:hypothetical protein
LGVIQWYIWPHFQEGDLIPDIQQSH